MAKYFAARVLAIIPTVFLVLAAVVMFVRVLPGSAIDVMMEEQGGARGHQREEIERRLGLDKSLPEDLLTYTWGAIRGDFGKSIWTQEPVAEVIGSRLHVSIKLGVLALVLAAVSGVSVGIIAAVMQNSAADYALRSFTIVNLSVPNFAVATLAVVMPLIWFGWAPSVIYKQPSAGMSHYMQFLLPGIILGLASSATTMRITRTMMLEVMRQDYIRTARSKGLAEHKVILRHALRNAFIPVVSVLGLQLAGIISGTVIIETVFSLPGVGRLLVTSIVVRDYPMSQGITVVVALSVILANLTVDLSYGWLDPRAKVTERAAS